MRTLLLAAISGYQRYISPHKGFCCAYSCHTGRSSCSVLGFRAVRRYGVWRGLSLLRRRTYLCGVAYRRYSQPTVRQFQAQQGYCDIGCDAPCEMPDLDCRLRAGDLAGCLDCGSCDWPERRRRRKEREDYVYIPPRVGSRKDDTA